ncbi:MAG: hypothetical protein K1X57_16270 [Gemmataceae bacterium]|nr:hypothetical protein [Gemmataceae bacterium]
MSRERSFGIFAYVLIGMLVALATVTAANVLRVGPDEAYANMVYDTVSPSLGMDEHVALLGRCNVELEWVRESMCVVTVCKDYIIVLVWDKMGSLVYKSQSHSVGSQSFWRYYDLPGRPACSRKWGNDVKWYYDIATD